MTKAHLANVAANHSSINWNIPRKCRKCRGTKCNNVHPLQETNCGTCSVGISKWLRQNL